MNKTRYLIFALFIIGLFTLGCEDEGLNEMDVMQVTQKASLSVQVMESETNRPIYGAKVTLSASGQVFSMNTDSAGMVYFSDLSQQDDARIKVVKDGYFLYSTSLDISPSYRSAGEFLNVYLNSAENAAIIKGTVNIQTDLTTVEPEHPEGITIQVLDYYNSNIIASTVTNSKGEFKLEFPGGRYVKMNFPTLEYDQTLKVRDTSNTVVTTTAYGTVFNPYTPAETVPNTSNVIATVDQPDYQVAQTYWRASVKSLTIESGVITGLELGYLGQGYYYWTDSYINISSLDGGSGADIRVTGMYTGSSEDPYYPLDPGTINIVSGGSGYPVHEPNENVYTISPSGFRWPGTYYWYADFVNNRSKYFSVGEVYVMNVDYGTGTTLGDIPVEF